MQPNKTQQADIADVWDKVAETYDTRAVLGADYQANLKILVDCFGDPKGKRICEVGCGSGLLSAVLGGMGAKIALVDISEKSLSFARAHFESLGIEAEYHLEDALNMTFPSGTFDLVWNDGVLEHFTDEGKIGLIKEMWRVVAPGGALMIRVPHFWDVPFTISKFVMERMGTWRFGYEDDLTVGRMTKLAKAAGIENPDVFAYNPVTGWWFMRYGREITQRLGLNTVEWHAKRNRLGHVVTLFARKPAV